MILTDDFVILNHPKTGSTFIRQVIKEIENNRENVPRRYKSTSRRWNVVRILSACRLRKIKYLELYHPRLLSKTKYVDQHGGASQVPFEYRGLPHAVAVRNPYDWYVSAYEFEWWKDNPQVEEAELNKKLSNFPDLSFKDYLEYKEIQVNEIISRNNISTKIEIGYQAFEYVRTLFRNPKYVLENLCRDFVLSKEYREHLPNIELLRKESLNGDLYRFVVKYRYYEKESEGIIEREKIYPKGRGRRENDWEDYYDEEITREVYERNEILFLILKDLGVEYRTMSDGKKP